MSWTVLLGVEETAFPAFAATRSNRLHPAHRHQVVQRQHVLRRGTHLREQLCRHHLGNYIVEAPYQSVVALGSTFSGKALRLDVFD